MQTLRQDLTTLLNRHSAESISHTPDFILAEYLIDCLAAYDRATAARTRFHHGVNETMEMVFNEPQLSATPTTTTPDLPPIGATLRFTQDGFNCASEVVGTEVVVIGHDGYCFSTNSSSGTTTWHFHVSDWREGLEIVKLPEA